MQLLMAKRYKQTGFDFWTDNTSLEVTKEEDVLNISYNFVVDAFDGENPSKDYCNKYGHELNSKIAMR